MNARLLCAVFGAAMATTALGQSTIGFTQSGSAVQENAGTVQFTVIRAGSLTGSAQVDFETRDGDAVPNVDYVSTSGTLHFGNGESEKTISLTVLDDNVTDAKRSTLLGIWLHNFVNSSGTQYYEYSVEIKDDEPPPPPPAFSYGNLTFDEGDGTTNTYLTVNLTRPLSQVLLVGFRYYPTPDAPAGVWLDGVRFEPGETTKQVPLKISGNDTYNGVASSSYHFAPVFAYFGEQITPTPFEITIVEDDPIATVSISDISVPEGSCGPTPIEITLTSSAPVNGVVNWTMSDGTATQADIDYGPFGVPYPVQMINTTTAKLTLVAPYGDLNIEDDETFTVTLTSATNMNIGDGTATVTIENDDFESAHFVEDLVRIEAGDQSTLRINFPAPAPAGKVLLSSSDARVKVPASVDVPERATSVAFTADATQAAGRVTVTADLAGKLGATQLRATVDAFKDSDLHFDTPRRTAFSGETSVASLTLDPPQKEAVTVMLSASAGIVVQESAIVPPGGTVEFPFTSLSAGKGWINATYGEESQQLVVDVARQELNSFAPDVAPTAGGTQVLLKGVGFSPGCTASFGTAAAPTTFVDAQTLIAKTPALAAQSVNVTVTCGLTPATVTTQFRFANTKQRSARH